MAELSSILLILVLLIGIVVAYFVGYSISRSKRDKYWQEQIPEHRKDAIMRSRSVIGGQFSEQLAPYLPNFNYLPTECRFLGKPVDFIVFKGMDNKEISEVIFVEAKSGNSKLSSQEKSLKEAIDKKRVRWEEYRVPEGLTKGKEKDE